MLRVACWVESRAPSLKLLPALRAHDKPFTTPLSEIKEFSSFFIILSRSFSKITCFHASTQYASISFDRTISTLVRWFPLPVVWTNQWLPHYLLCLHHQEPMTLSRVSTCPADIGIGFWPGSLISSNFLIRTWIYMWFAPLASFQQALQPYSTFTCIWRLLI